MATLTRLSLLIGVFFVSSCLGSCPNYWISDNGSCYALVHQPATWWDALETCKLWKSSLVQINSVTENNFLKNLIRTHGSSPVGVWTAGNDLLSEGNWLWGALDGSQTAFTFTDWNPGEPTNSNGMENCLDFFKYENYRWNDEDCDTKFSFICERPEGEGLVIG